MIIYSNYRVLTDTKEEISPEPPNQSSLISSYKRTLNSLKNTLFSHSNDWIRKLSAWSTIWGEMLLGKSRKFNQTLNTTPVIFLINQNRLKCNPGILNPKFIRPLSTSWKILFFFLIKYSLLYIHCTILVTTVFSKKKNRKKPLKITYLKSILCQILLNIEKKLTLPYGNELVVKCCNNSDKRFFFLLIRSVLCREAPLLIGFHLIWNCSKRWNGAKVGSCWNSKRNTKIEVDHHSVVNCVAGSIFR